MSTMRVVAWAYKCWDTTHLIGKKLDSYFSTDNGETFVKGDPLVREADALAAIKAARVQALEEAAKVCEPANMDRPSDWTYYASIRAECAIAVRRLLGEDAGRDA